LLLASAAAGCAPSEPGASARGLFADRIEPLVHADTPFSAHADGFSAASGAPLGMVLPQKGDGAARLSTGWLELSVREEGATGEGKLEGNAVTYAREGGTSFWTASSTGYEEWLLLDAPAVVDDRPVASWAIEGASLRQEGDAVAIVDAGGAARVWVTAPAAYAASGAQVGAHVKAAGERIELWVEARGEPVLVDPLWSTVGAMKQGRQQFPAVRLADGRVLAIGGSSGGSTMTYVDIFNPATNTWSAAAPMNCSRSIHTGTLLADGRVLVTGGIASCPGLSIEDAERSAEIYNPATNTWTFAPAMSQGRQAHSAFRLPDGRVLVMGSLIYYTSPATDVVDSAEIYDPATNSWQPVAWPHEPHTYGTDVLLADGRILTTGGTGTHGTKCEIYDPATNTWTVAAPMHDARTFHTATLLPSGKVYVAGGSQTAQSPTQQTAEIYDPATNTWTYAPPLLNKRYEQTALRLDSGEVLLIGGAYGSGQTTEIYREGAAQNEAFLPLTASRYAHSSLFLNDGRILVAGGYGTTSVNATSELLYWNIGLDKRGPFASGAGSQNNALRLADINADGKLDMLVLAGGYVKTQLGSGDGTFSGAQGIYSAGTTPGSFAVGDLDGNGRLDLVVSNSGSNDLTIRRGSASAPGTFLSSSTVATGTDPREVLVRDLGGDGRADVAVAVRGANQVLVLQSYDSSTGFGASQTYAVPGNPVALAAGDFDGDGVIDLVAATDTGHQLHLLRGAGGGSFQAATVVGSSFASFEDVQAGDIDGDGKLDLVAGGGGSGVYTFHGNGDGTFGAGVSLGNYPTPQTLALADLDADGDLDIALRGYTGPNNGAISGAIVLRNDGGGVFTQSSANAIGMALDIVQGDIDGDGDVDLALASAQRGYVLLRNHGDATFQAPALTPFGLGAFAAATADFDGDGRQDVVIGNEQSGVVSIFHGDAAGGLGARQDLEWTTIPVTQSFVAATDVEGDGDADVLIGVGSDNSVLLYRNDGGGTFTQKYLASVTAPRAAAAVDLDGDGDRDLLVLSSTNAGVYVLKANGDGTYAGKIKYSTGTSSSPRAMALADVNGDGKIDVITANYGTNNASVLRGNGDGSFQAAVTVTASGISKPVDVSAGDVDGDGDVDFALANNGSSDVQLFLNGGSGSFTAGLSRAAGSSTRAVRIADLNGDGRADIAAVASTSNSLSLFLGTGGGAFMPTATVGVSTSPRAIALGDLDGDGRPDLAVPSYNSNDVTVLRNTSP
jgi:hypothetical protein